MSRPKAFDTTAALDAAVRVFWERGYEATSVQDLVDALGINRASLYGTFGDKAQLFEAALERYGAQVQADLEAYLAPPHAGREAIAAYFAAAIERATRPGVPGGCLMLNTAAACTAAPPELIDRAASSLRKNQEALYRALRRDPTLCVRKDLRHVARFFAAEAHGLGMLARTGATASQLREAANVALRVLDASTTH